MFHTVLYAAPSDRENPKDTMDVIPPAFEKILMTKKSAGVQKKSTQTERDEYRQQLYADDLIHDVERAICYLRKNIIGFFTSAPLDFGLETAVDSNPSKFMTIDIAQNERRQSIGEGAAS